MVQPVAGVLDVSAFAELAAGDKAMIDDRPGKDVGNVLRAAAHGRDRRSRKEERTKGPDERLDCNPTIVNWRARYPISQFQKWLLRYENEGLISNFS